MYVPAHFEMPAEEVAAALGGITAADLITPTPDGLQATFLPLLYEPGTDSTGGAGGTAAPLGRLLGHVARNNPHWKSAAADPSGIARADESLVIARGPDAYISPAWYPSKAEHGRVVPTWNYTTLHVHGRLVAHDDPEWLRGLVTRLTDRHEAALPEHTPWRVSDAPAQYLDGQLRAIVGLELLITRVDAKAKLSQNRPAADVDGAIDGLRAIDPGDPTARAMRAAQQR